MEATLIQAQATEEQVIETPAQVVRELTALELALVGGGTANVAFI